MTKRDRRVHAVLEYSVELPLLIVMIPFAVITLLAVFSFRILKLIDHARATTTNAPVPINLQEYGTQDLQMGANIGNNHLLGIHNPFYTSVPAKQPVE
jgi:heme/copper-type cytochrome/quinol oxidase subunit 2